MTTLIGQTFWKKGKQSCIANASVIDYDTDNKQIVVYVLFNVYPDNECFFERCVAIDADKKDLLDRPLARKAINQALDILKQTKEIDLKPSEEPDINLFMM